MMATAVLVKDDLSIAKAEISAAWRPCKKSEKYGLKFGKVCYEWQQKFATIGGVGNKGKGISPIWDELNIPHSTAYRWIEVYKEEAGLAAKRVVSSESNEWYTPAKYLEAAREVLGGIDLDPASCELANETVKASVYYTIADDGLVKDWGTRPRIWLNPPWGEAGPAFIQRLVEEYESGNIEAAIVLVNSHCTDTGWFQPLLDHVLCHTNHRIDFYRESQRDSSSTHGSTFVYFGEEQEKFAEVFQRFGKVLEPFGQSSQSKSTRE